MKHNVDCKLISKNSLNKALSDIERIDNTVENSYTTKDTEEENTKHQVL